jgi:hypothetical protein
MLHREAFVLYGIVQYGGTYEALFPVTFYVKVTGMECCDIFCDCGPCPALERRDHSRLSSAVREFYGCGRKE